MKEPVRAAVEDWKPMQARMADVIARLESARSGVPHEELEEGRAFLAWLLNHHFTFLGCRDYDIATVGGEDVLRIVPTETLRRGILRFRDFDAFRLRSLIAFILLRRRSNSSALKFFGTPLASRPRDWAALFMVHHLVDFFLCRSQ